MSNSVVIRNSLVVFSGEDMDIHGFLAAIRDGAETYEKRKGGCEPALSSAITALLVKHVDENSLLEACADMVAHFARAQGHTLHIDFYPENYRGDVSLRSLHFLVNRLVRPFVKQHKTHTFEVADWATLVEDGREIWVPVTADFLEGMALTESQFNEMLGASNGTTNGTAGISAGGSKIHK